MQPQFRHIAVGLALGLGPLSIESARALDVAIASSRPDLYASRPADQATKARAMQVAAATSKPASKKTAKASARRHPTKVVTRAPLRLTPTQSSIVYHTIVDRAAAPPQVVTLPAPGRTILVPPPPVIAAPIVTEEIVTAVPEEIVGAPRVIVTAPPVVVTRPPAVVTAPPSRIVTQVAPAVEPTTIAYRVGAPLPQTVPLYDLPASVSATVPAVRGYRYAQFNDRVLLIDPVSNVVVAELDR